MLFDILNYQYNIFSIHLSDLLKKGDLIFVRGKKMILSLPGKFGYIEKTEAIVSTSAYILETAEARKKRKKQREEEE